MPVNEKYNISIAESLLPTFKNVSKMFIVETMEDILLDDAEVNFNIYFEEEAAFTYISQVLKDYVKNEYNGFEERANKILDSLTNKKHNDLPTLVVSDYVTFFNNLTKLYEKYIELFVKRTTFSGLQAYVMRNCLKHIWLRATPEDFVDPERFLDVQFQMISDNVFEDYFEEQTLGEFPLFDNSVIALQSQNARVWDELDKEFRVTIYEKEFFHRTELFDRPHYILPVIRYGIYEKDGRAICRIGSIQNKNSITSEKLAKVIGRQKYKVNKGVSEELLSGVEPTSLIALWVFINCLHDKGITCIEIPSMYVLDYQYHQKNNSVMINQFQEYWTDNMKRKYPKQYVVAKEELDKSLNQEEFIVKRKSENFIKTILRLTAHYANVSIESYPTEVENYLRINVPPIQDKSEIDNELLQALYVLSKSMQQKKI